MNDNGVFLFDLPVLTRMISSPGALSGTIPSDVLPFGLSFFEHTVFLTQSSQLYLEFAITNPHIDHVYCWEKSFRNENADYRHLPEFTHVEYEGNIPFDDCLTVQEQYLGSVLKYLLAEEHDALTVFLDATAINDLAQLAEQTPYERITFDEAFTILASLTGESRYNKPTISSFGAVEEILLANYFGKPLFVTHYIRDEVAFYHESSLHDPLRVLNADLLWPGYGEITGSGQRIVSREDIQKKASQFELNINDYALYIESRDCESPTIHSGWGMGIERFLQAILRLPFIWEARVFPRTDASIRP